jgi:hypothetical protein
MNEHTAGLIDHPARQPVALREAINERPEAHTLHDSAYADDPRRSHRPRTQPPKRLISITLPYSPSAAAQSRPIIARQRAAACGDGALPHYKKMKSATKLH